MTETKRRRVLTLLLSLLVAVLTWFYVNADETVTVHVGGVPVEFLNEDTTLAERGFMLSAGKDTALDLELRLPRSKVFFLDTDKIRLVADLTTVTATGPQVIGYTIVYPDNFSARDITVESPTERTVPIEVGELFRKELDIRCNIVGNVAEGYLAGSVEMLPGKLEVRGQQADIMQLSYAQVTLNITDATSTIVELLDYKVYDFNDREAEPSAFHPVSGRIQVTMPVMVVKEIPLTVAFRESAGFRKSSIQWRLNPETITVCGDAAALTDFNALALDSISIAELEAKSTFRYEIRLPEGVSNLSGVSTAELTVSLGSIGQKTYDVSQFSVENLNTAGRVAEVVTTVLPVTLHGLKEDLSAIAAENITVVADLGNVSDASGIYTVPARIRVDSDRDVGAVDTYQITVRLSTPQDPEIEVIDLTDVGGSAQRTR